MRFWYGIISLFAFFQAFHILVNTGRTGVLGFIGFIIWCVLFITFVKRYRRADAEHRRRRQAWRNDPTNWSI